jgi:hypothetical protein
MPKINGKNIDPKVYAKRVTEAKKKVASMDPEVKQKIKEMYPKVTKEAIVKKALSAKKSTPSLTAKPVVTKATPAATPKAKPKTLNDFLKEGKRPPSKNKKIPSDADVIIKGYNDKKTLSKNKTK